MDQVTTCEELLEKIESGFQNPKALAEHTEEGWRFWSTQQMLQEVRAVAVGLLALGVRPGDCVGIFAPPSPRWTIADLAIMLIGATSVPIFSNISEDNFLFQVAEASIKTFFVGGKEQWIRCNDHMRLFTNLIGIDGYLDSPETVSYPELLRLAQARQASDPQLLEKTSSAVKPETLATIIYTSGSTGIPKGVEHTHFSITGLLHTPIFHWNSQKDCYLSFLPLAHVFARILNFIMISWGLSIYYWNDPHTLSAACQEIRPTVMVVVPRVLEKMAVKMKAKIQEGSWIKRKIGNWALSMAQKEHHSLLERLMRPLADHAVYRHLRHALGGRLRVVFCGGAPLSPSLYRFFLFLRFPIFEGWGLTESCPVTVNCPGHLKVGTVGPPLPSMEVKVSPTGELLVKGPMMMRGYYKNSAATEAALDTRGYLHTGDRGFIDTEGFVTIQSRIKEVLKTSTGEIIASIPIEQALCSAPFIEGALVIGNEKKFASCLLIPDFEWIHKWKEKLQLTHLSDSEFLLTDPVQKEVKLLLERVNSRLNPWEKLLAYRFIDKPLSVDTGDLTPSMKLRREALESKYRPLIDSMYGE